MQYFSLYLYPSTIETTGRLNSLNLYHWMTWLCKLLTRILDVDVVHMQVNDRERTNNPLLLLSSCLLCSEQIDTPPVLIIILTVLQPSIQHCKKFSKKDLLGEANR